MKTQIILCKCGSIIAGAHEPHCYTSANWTEAALKAADDGYIVKTIATKTLADYTWNCTCKK
jgi:hypothetical protein